MSKNVLNSTWYIHEIFEESVKQTAPERNKTTPKESTARSSVHLNGHTLGFHAPTRQIKPHYIAL